MEKTNQKKKADVYELVTNRIIAHLENGEVPWQRTWIDGGIPQNIVSKKAFRGINIFLLASLGFKKNYFLTYQQALSIGATIKKGEQSNFAIFWQWDKDKNQTSESSSKYPTLRYYLVYNVEQCEGIPLDLIPEIPLPFDPKLECQRIVDEMPVPPAIRFIRSEQSYSTVEDCVSIPPIYRFKNSESYYETLFHELIHSTRHPSRLNRGAKMKDNQLEENERDLEELIAELGTCFLKSCAGLKGVGEYSAEYLKKWLTKFKENKRTIVYAASQAQRAVDFILNIHPHIPVKTEEEEIHE
jgi:antirestriction protein ArdC